MHSAPSRWASLPCPVPFGGGGGAKQQWIEHEFERLERFDTIYLALDNDPPGQQATAEIVERLGAHRCMVVDIPAPHKDINDLLRAGWTPDQLRTLFERQKPSEPTELRWAALYADDVVREFYPTNGSEPGFTTPWPKLHGRLAFRLGEASILAGTNGSGKSELVSHVLLGGMTQGERACVASLEFKVCEMAEAPDPPTTPAVNHLRNTFTRFIAGTAGSSGCSM